MQRDRNNRKEYRQPPFNTSPSHCHPHNPFPMSLYVVSWTTTPLLFLFSPFLSSSLVIPLALLYLLLPSSFLSSPPPPTLHLSLSVHPSPHLSASLSPGSSCNGVVRLAKRGRRRHTDGSTDGQQAVWGGQAHLLHTHKHTYRALLCHLITLPACLAQWYRDTNTNTQRHSFIHTYLHTFSCKAVHVSKYLHIHRSVHALVVCVHCKYMSYIISP